jgi:hypothetical protein
MPLIHSKKDSAVGTNIKRELEAGKPQDQAIAIALDVQRESKTKKSENLSDLKLIELLINKGEGIQCSCGKGLNCSCSKATKAIGDVGPNTSRTFNPLGIGYNIGYGMGSEAGSAQLQAPNTMISAAAQAPRTLGRMMSRGGNFKDQQVQDAEQALNPQESIPVPGVQHNPRSIPLPPTPEPSVPNTPPTVGPHFMDQVAAAAPAQQPPPPSVGPGAGWNKQNTQATPPVSAPPTTKLAPLVPQGPATPPAPKMPANFKLAPTNKPVDMSSSSENFGGNIGPALPQVHSSNIGPALVPPPKPPVTATPNAFSNAPKTVNSFRNAPKTINEFKTAPKTVNDFANSPQTVKITRPALPPTAPATAPKPAMSPRPSAPTPAPIAAPKPTPSPMSAPKRGRGSPGGIGTGNPNRGQGGKFGFKNTSPKPAQSLMKPPTPVPLTFPEHDTTMPPKTTKSWYTGPLSSTPFYMRSTEYDPNAIIRSATTQTNRMYTALAEPIRDTLNNVVEDEQVRTHNTYKSCDIHGLLHKSNSVCPICRSSQESMRSAFDPFGGMKTNLK